MTARIAKAERYEDIGQALRESRESLGLDLHDIARQMNMRAKYLHALEEGDLNELPGSVYIRGYLQKYAVFLGLPAGDILRQYEALQGEPEPQNFYIPEPTRKENSPTPQILAVAGGLVLLFFLCWYVFLHETPPSVEEVSEVPEHFSYLLSERFRLTNELYACFQEREPLYYPFCTKLPVPEIHEIVFDHPILSVVQKES